MAGKRKLTGRQLRWLFATGRLRASGKGKDRKVTYSKDAGAPKRAVIGGSKAAGLRGGSASVRPDYSATRAQRIAAGRERLRSTLESNRSTRLKVRDARDLQQTHGLSSIRSGNKARVAREKSAAASRANFQRQQAENERNSTRAARIAAGRERLREFGQTAAGKRLEREFKSALKTTGSRAAALKQVKATRRRQSV